MNTNALLKAKTIEHYQRKLSTIEHVIRNTDGGLTVENLDAFLRAFRWYAREAPFEDIRHVSEAIMPVFAAYVQLSREREAAGRPGLGSTAEVEQALWTLADYLDGGVPTASETEPAHKRLRATCYYVADEVARLADRVAEIVAADPKDAELRARASEAAAEVLALGPLERVERFKDVFLALNTAKELVYGLMRSKGDTAVLAIEAAIADLQPADQDYFLHALDAFPSNEEVVAFYDRFLASAPPESLAAKVRTYRERVSSGVKTTGWER